MPSPLIAVIDGSKARIFSVEVEEEVVGRPRRSKLIEIEDLVQPGHRAKAKDQFSESRPGLRSGGNGSGGHGVDDHRDANKANADRKFIAEVFTSISKRASEHNHRRLIVAAGPEVLGVARSEKHRLGNIEVVELAKHLTGLSPHEIHTKLTDSGLIR
jgi:protein required for attachment to host cells